MVYCAMLIGLLCTIIHAAEPVSPSKYIEYRHKLTDLSWSPKGLHLAALKTTLGNNLIDLPCQQQINIYDTHTLKKCAHVSGCYGSKIKYCPSHEHLIAAIHTAESECISIWDTRTRKKVTGLQLTSSSKTPNSDEEEPNPQAINSFAWSPDGTKIAVTTEETLLIYDLTSAKNEYSKQLKAPMATIDWSVKNKLCVKSLCSDSLEVFEPHVEQLTTYYFSPSAFNPHWSPDGNKVALTDYDCKHILIYDTTNMGQLYLDTQHVCSPSWSPNGKTIAIKATRYGTISLCDTIKGTVKRNISVDSDPEKMTWSPTGRLLAVILKDHPKPILWDVTGF